MFIFERNQWMRAVGKEGGAQLFIHKSRCSSSSCFHSFVQQSYLNIGAYMWCFLLLFSSLFPLWLEECWVRNSKWITWIPQKKNVMILGHGSGTTSWTHRNITLFFSHDHFNQVQRKWAWLSGREHQGHPQNGGSDVFSSIRRAWCDLVRGSPFILLENCWDFFVSPSSLYFTSKKNSKQLRWPAPQKSSTFSQRLCVCTLASLWRWCPRIIPLWKAIYDLWLL